ncbi:MAG: WD40 repeat domain-containing protein [Planctomycetes bacterium]|nr:WD40 repeat domain-containing protein [Planctomycetota bacterium]
MLGFDLKMGEAMLFDLKTGQMTRTFRSHKGHLRHVQFSPKNNHALLSFYDFSVLWDTNTGKTIRQFDQGGIAQFSSDGSNVLIYDNLLAKRYDVATGKQIEIIQLPPFGRSFKGSYARLNAHIPNEVRRDASGKLIYNFEASSVQAILDINTGKEIGRCPSNTGWCFVSGATKSVFEGGPSRPYNIVRVYNFDQKEIDRFDMPPSELTGLDGYLLAVSSGGKKFLYARNVKGSDDTSDVVAHYLTMNYALYNAETGKEIRSLGEYELGYSATFSPDGRHTILVPTFGSSGKDVRDPEIIVVSNATGTVDHRFYTGPWSIPSVDFDQTGTRLLVAGSINVDFWRRFGEWRQLEQQKPMPRKVADLLRSIANWKASKLNTKMKDGAR